MVQIVYLILVINSSSAGITVTQIPQANMKQCQVNKSSYDGIRHSGNSVSYGTKAHCIVGVK